VGQQVSLQVLRVPKADGETEIPLITLPTFREHGTLDEVLLKRVLYEISCRNYEAAAAAVPGAIGLSCSTVSLTFSQASSKQLQLLQERDLRDMELVAVFLDGKAFADMMMVIAVGITLTGEKFIVGFVEPGTENEQVLMQFLQPLGDRGVDISQGLLVISDGGKGLRSGGGAGLWILGAGTAVPVAQTGKRREAFTKKRAGDVAKPTPTSL
jgi:transposase-like protein